MSLPFEHCKGKSSRGEKSCLMQIGAVTEQQEIAFLDRTQSNPWYLHAVVMLPGLCSKARLGRLAAERGRTWMNPRTSVKNNSSFISQSSVCWDLRQGNFLLALLFK